MSKDYMTEGHAAWITYADPAGTVPSEKTNPWETPIGAADQFAPIVDKNGIALFRKTFTVRELKAARVDATALGIYDLYVNGKRVGRQAGREDAAPYDELKPGWTDYTARCLYYSYDLAPYLTEGENTLLAAVAPGWYNGRIALGTYGETHIALLAAIRLSDADGERVLYTDKTWEASWGSAIRAADIWDGEMYDANQPSLAAISEKQDSLHWGAPAEETHDLFVTPQVGSTITVRPNLTRKPETVTVYRGTEDNGSDYGKIHVVRTLTENSFTLAAGEAAVLDFGQNMVGWPTFTARGAAGTSLQIRFGEMLNDSGLKSRGNDNPEGSIYSINYRSAKAKLCYILNGQDNAYRPTFSFFGFRYCEIRATADVTFENLTAEVVGSANRETGHMETSNADVNRLISNVLWGQRGNYLSVPTDCPQRDERLGWTGDTQAFCCTAAYNADVDGFFHKWLQDARDSQAENGMYPDVIPKVRVVGWGGAAWSDAGIIVPYTMWKMYADTDIIREHYASMERYMDWLATTELSGPNATYGDWLAYEPTDARYISVAYYALDARYMAAMSRAIDRADRAAHYDSLFEQVCDHFRRIYCNAEGDLNPEVRTQTGYLLALRNDLLLPERRPAAVAALKQKIIDNGYKLSTGFVGSCILNEVLAEFGENDLAYSLLLQTENPSWLYSVHQGATTIWERWNSYTKATGFGDVGMNSFNHYAYGAVQEWMYRHIAGIETTEQAPGFAHPILQPKPDTRSAEEIPAGQEKITWVRTSFASPVGLIESAWDMTD
ncbi:MAG: alpha-rhamnosidase, partial [Oscillospiraceae bacterium]